MAIIKGAETLFDIVTDTSEVENIIKFRDSIVSFMADWCGPCVRTVRSLRYNVEVMDFLRRNDIKMFYVDVDSFPDYSAQNIFIGVPHFDFYTSGKYVGSIVGFVDGRKILDLLEEIYSKKPTIQT